MVDTATIRTIVGIIGNVVSCILFLSPIPTFVRIIKQKGVQDFKSDPYLATLLSCSMWCFYGMPFIKSNNILVLTINVIGLVMELIYIIIYFIYAPAKKRRNIVIAIIVDVVFMAAVVVIAMFAFHTKSKRALFVGILCIIFSVIMYGSPLTVMRMVIKTESLKFMPFYLSLATFANGALWLAYALLKFDLNLVIPNGLGTFLALMQLILYAIYYRTSKRNDDNTSNNPNHRSESDPNLQLSTV